MYEVLKYNWKEMRGKDLLYRSNSVRMVMEFNGADLPGAYSKEDSDIIIFYNYYDGSPFLLVERVRRVLTPNEIKEIGVDNEDFMCTVNVYNEEGYTEIVCTAKRLIESLSSTEF